MCVYCMCLCERENVGESHAIVCLQHIDVRVCISHKPAVIISGWVLPNAFSPSVLWRGLINCKPSESSKTKHCEANEK